MNKLITCMVCGQDKDREWDFTQIEDLVDFPVVMCNECFEKGQREQDSEYPDEDEE